ncbi:unnamed protein product [Leptosia nina]|uniref:Uncharacterized protein n=1 Tax=Leptosia nina TaxID=320188 RepID=A0AAV1IY50_9NEOP
MFSLFLIGIYFVLSEACTTYNFEDRYSDDFTNQRGLCDGQPMWLLRNYTEIEVERPHELSEKFISPNPSISCVASFLFEVTANGTIEINVYMETSNLNDQISIMANEVRTNDDDATVGHVLLGPRFTPDFTSGWHLLQLTLTGSGTYTGYVSILRLSINIYEAARGRVA